MKKILGIFGLLVFVVLVAVALNPVFIKPGNIENLIHRSSLYAIISIGVAFVIFTGGIDLSVGALIGYVGVLLPMLLTTYNWPVPLAVVTVLALCAATGLWHGLLITKLRLQPFIVTLATLLAVRGLALTLAGTRAAVAAPGDFQKLGDWSLLGLPVAAWAMLFAFLVGAGVLNYTAWGRRVLAIGGNVDAARLMGLPVARTTFSVYVLSGALAGCAGVFLGSQNGSVDTAAGQGWELSAIAAVVVGGTLLTGGVGSVLSSLVGVLLLQLIFNLIVFENGKGFISISSFWESVIRGGFLLVVVLLQVRLVRRRDATGRPT